jgi:uncharacterized beta-barrel protein YwiB (DUF1934 family)
MRKQAIISLISKQKENENDIIEVVTPGKFYKKEQEYYVVYEETEISGMEGTTTTLKINKDKLTLLRKGTTNTKMIFEEDYRDTILYSTPHGVLELLVDTKQIQIDINDMGGEVKVNYDMSIAGQNPLTTQLEVSIKSQQEEWEKGQCKV